MTEAALTALIATETARITALKASFDAMVASSTAGTNRQVEQNRLDDSMKMKTILDAINSAEKRLDALQVELSQVPTQYVNEVIW